MYQKIHRISFYFDADYEEAEKIEEKVFRLGSFYGMKLQWQDAGPCFGYGLIAESESMSKALDFSESVTNVFKKFKSVKLQK